MDAVLPAASAATKTRSSLLALAICDALGGPAEFRRRGTFPRITTLQRNETFHLPPGTWTDDTSMALCLADSLCSLPGSFSEEDQARRYIRWFQDGYLSATDYCFDIGSATRTALEIWHGGGGLPQVRHSLDEKWRCGNGSLMRVLPVALALWRTGDGGEAGEVGELAARSSVVTHPHKLCQEACRVYVSLVTRVLRAADRGEALTKGDLLEMLKRRAWENTELREVFATGEFVRKDEAQIKSSGYVVDTLEAALWGFFGTASFEEGAIAIVNLGDDADTVAAVYGGLAGAWYAIEERFWQGRTGEWHSGLVRREVVEEMAERLVRLQWVG